MRRGRSRDSRPFGWSLSIRRSPNARAASSRPPATACWWNFTASPKRCAAPWTSRSAWRGATATCRRRGSMLYRIGINLGDVIVEENDIFGDGVNVAARLEFASGAGRHLHFRARCAIRSATGWTVDYRGSRRPERQEHQPADPRLQGRAERRSSGRRSSRRRRRAAAPQASAKQAVDRRPAFRQHERRSGAGVLRRRAHRGHHHRAVALPRSPRHLAQRGFRAQGQGGEGAGVAREFGVEYVVEGSVRKARIASG